MSDIQTTGGIFTEKSRKVAIDNICSVFQCSKNDVKELKPIQKGMSNIILSFRVNDEKFIYRHPGKNMNNLVDRKTEAIMQTIVTELGIDTTVIAMDVNYGWKISKFIKNLNFDYHNPENMTRAMMLLRRLHEAPCKVRCNADVIKMVDGFKAQIPINKYGKLNKFDEINTRCQQLYTFTKKDEIRYCYVHIDARNENFLINENEIYLIDWEYGGYGDPGIDIGSYICGEKHSIEDIEKILYTYYKDKPTDKQKRHCYAYIALSSWLCLHWVMFKEAMGQTVERNKELWYQYANDFSKRALLMYAREDGGVK